MIDRRILVPGDPVCQAEMVVEFDDAALVEVVRDAQRFGFIGDRPILDAIEHSRGVVAALAGSSGRVVDLGSGGGLPGFVIACDRPDLDLSLVDRRAKRTDFLERMVRRYRLMSRVSVLAIDAEQLLRECASGKRTRFDAAVARGFGPPDVTLRTMAAVVRPAGRLVITEPPSGDRWDPELLDEVGVRRAPGPSGVAVFVLLDDA